jgi:tetratricopeptide (TPR) repeat protein
MTVAVRIERARLLLAQSRYDLAAAELHLALADAPSDPVVFALFAECLTGQKKYAEAAEMAEKAIVAAPDLPIGHFALGLVQFRRHRYPEAEVAADEAIALDPTNPDYHALKAAIRSEREDWTGALIAADRGLEQDPEHTWCSNVRAWALIKLKKGPQAGATLDAALARDPEDAFTHANRGWGYLHDGDPKQAAVHFRESLRLDPELELARIGMIEALKARYRLYRWVLGYFLWMSRFSPQTRWMIVVGVVVIQQVIAAVGKRNPALEPYLFPILVGYLVFVLTTWAAVPISNLFLRLNQFGRHVLSPDQRRATTWSALTLTLALGAVGYALFSDYDFLGWDCALAFALLLLPVSATYACPTGWPRRVMAVVTFAIAGIVLTGTGMYAYAVSLDYSDPRTAVQYAHLGTDFLIASYWSSGGSTFLANWLASRQPRL